MVLAAQVGLVRVVLVESVRAELVGQVALARAEPDRVASDLVDQVDSVRVALDRAAHVVQALGRAVE